MCKKKLILVLDMVLLLMPMTVLADHNGWDGHVQGKISRIDVTGEENYGFRVMLENNPVLCSGGDTWAYLNGSDSNYKVYVAQLTAAKYANRNVILYTRTPSSTTRCHLGYIVVL